MPNAEGRMPGGECASHPTKCERQQTSLRACRAALLDASVGSYFERLEHAAQRRRVEAAQRQAGLLTYFAEE
jgi:hypothetical protein